MYRLPGYGSYLNAICCHTGTMVLRTRTRTDNISHKNEANTILSCCVNASKISSLPICIIHRGIGVFVLYRFYTKTSTFPCCVVNGCSRVWIPFLSMILVHRSLTTGKHTVADAGGQNPIHTSNAFSILHRIFNDLKIMYCSDIESHFVLMIFHFIIWEYVTLFGVLEWTIAGFSRGCIGKITMVPHKRHDFYL